MNSRFLFCLPLFAFIVALGGPSGLLAAEKLAFGTAIKENPVYALPMLAGEEKGLWKEEGLEVQWVPFRGGALMYRAVAAGSINVGWGDIVSHVQAMVGGLPVILVADLQIEYPFFLWVKADSPIKEPKDLKGARIGVNVMGGVAHAMARLVAKSLGVEKDVRIVAGGGISETIAAFKAGAIDGLVFSIYAMMPLKVKGEARELAAVRDYLPREWTEQVIFTRKEFGEANPGTVRKVVRAVLRMGEFVKKNREWSTEKMKSVLGYNEEMARITHPLLNFGKDGRFNHRAVENVKTFMIEYGIVTRDKAPAAEQIYTRQFTE